MANLIGSKFLLMSAALLWLGMMPGAYFAGSGAALAAELVNEARDLPAFSRIDAEGSLTVRITVGEEQSVQVEAVARDLKRIKTEVIDDTLVFSYRERWFSFLFDDERIVTISVPALVAIEIAGSGDIEVRGIDSESFDVGISGTLDAVLSGTCSRLQLDVNGTSDIEARALKCDKVGVVVNGTGDASLFASQSIDAVINGVGDITVYGNPEKVSKEINGFGDFELAE